MTRLGFDAAVARNVGQLYERWDGKGLPHGLKGEAIAPAVRLVTLVQDAIVLSEAHGQAAALAIIKKRRGSASILAWSTAFSLVPSLCLRAPRRSQPGNRFWSSSRGLTSRYRARNSRKACLVIADFVDIRSPLLAGHSRAVATLAEAAARSCGMPESDAVAARRAGLVARSRRSRSADGNLD